MFFKISKKEIFFQSGTPENSHSNDPLPADKDADILGNFGSTKPRNSSWITI